MGGKLGQPDKWTAEKVTEVVQQIDKMVKNKPEIIFIGEVFENLPYYRQLWSEWACNFKDNEFISDTIKKVDSILEGRVASGAMRNKLNASMSIFNLKNNYGWKDEFHNKNEDTVRITDMDDKKSDALIKKYETEQLEEIEKEIKNVDK